MTRIALTSALLLGLAAPAFASNLANTYGFDAGAVSAQELAVLKASDTSEDNFANLMVQKDKIGGAIVSTQSGVSAGHAQLAASEGLDPTVYTVAEIAIIKGENDEEERARLVDAYGAGGIASSQSFGTPAHVALAKSLITGDSTTD